MLTFKMKLVRSGLALCNIWLKPDNPIMIGFEKQANKLSFQIEMKRHNAG